MLLSRHTAWERKKGKKAEEKKRGLVGLLGRRISRTSTATIEQDDTKRDGTIGDNTQHKEGKKPPSSDLGPTGTRGLFGNEEKTFLEVFEPAGREPVRSVLVFFTNLNNTLMCHNFSTRLNAITVSVYGRVMCDGDGSERQTENGNRKKE